MVRSVRGLQAKRLEIQAGNWVYESQTKLKHCPWLQYFYCLTGDSNPLELHVLQFNLTEYRKMKNILLFTSLLAVASASVAQSNAGPSNLYGEFAYQNFDLDSGDFPGLSTNNGVVSGIIGHQFHPKVSAELFLAGNVDKGSDTVGGIPFETKIKNSYGVFVRPSTMVGDKVELFGRVGYVRTKLQVSAAGISDSDSDGSFAYGLGANYHFSDRLYGQLSYTSLYDKDDVELKGFGAAIGYRF